MVGKASLIVILGFSLVFGVESPVLEQGKQ